MGKLKPNAKGLYRKTITYNGKRYDITAKNESALYMKIAQKQLELESGNIVMNKNTTVSRWCDEWLEVYKRPNVGHRHYVNLESTIRLHIKPEIGAFKLSDVKKIHLQKMLNSHEGESYGHVSKIRSCLYELFHAAVEEELIIKNPAQNLSLPNCSKKERVTFTDEEYNACLEVAKTHRGGAWIVAMLTCGLRPQETVPLLWTDIDLKERLVTIDKAAEFSGNRAIIKTTKTDAGKRVVGICDELYVLLVAAKKNTNSIYVFPNAKGGIMSSIAMRRLWQSFIRQVDIFMGAELYRNSVIESKLQPGLSPYSCRHTCITKLVLAGLDVKTVQVFAGHESAETTLKYYTHLTKANAARRVLQLHESGTNSGTKAENYC